MFWHQRRLEGWGRVESLLTMHLLHADRQGYMDVIINQRLSPGARFLVKEFGRWRVGNYRGEFQPGTCQKGSGFRKVRVGLEVATVGREAPGLGYHPQLGTGAKLPAHCPWALTPRLTPALLEEAGLRQVQSLAQSHTVPKGQSGTFTSPHSVLPTANSPLRGLRRQHKQPQLTFLLPHAHLLSASGIHSAHVPRLEAHFPLSSWELTQPRRTSTISYRDKGH